MKVLECIGGVLDGLHLPAVRGYGTLVGREFIDVPTNLFDKFEPIAEPSPPLNATFNIDRYRRRDVYFPGGDSAIVYALIGMSSDDIDAVLSTRE